MLEKNNNNYHVFRKVDVWKKITTTIIFFFNLMLEKKETTTIIFFFNLMLEETNH